MNEKIKKLILKSNKDKFPQKGFFTFLNPFSYLLLRKSKILSEFDGLFIDGISLVKVLSLFNIKVSRKSFDMTSLAPLIFEYAIFENKNIYFIGAKPNEIDQFINTIKKKHSQLSISGYRDGYFNSEDEKKSIIDNIVNDIKPDIIIVGMGTPLQEEFLIRLKHNGYSGLAFTCGGFIHQTSQEIDYYPNWINKYNLRWCYRIYDEPKLFKRYFVFYPKALFFILKDLTKFNKNFK